MNYSIVMEIMLALSVLAGALHMLAPDHWFPASILSWQRRWSVGRTLAFSWLVFSIHLGLGVLIFFTFSSFFLKISSADLFVFTLVLLISAMGIRLTRFHRLQEVVRAGPKSAWGVFAAVSLLGPCESIIPVFIKAQQLSMGYLTPFLAFYLGTLLCGWGCVLAGRRLWDRPQQLSKGFAWAYHHNSVLPVLVFLLLGLGVLFRWGA